MTDSPLLIEAVRAGCNAAFMSHCTFPECAEQNPGCITKASAFIAAIAHVLKAEPSEAMECAGLEADGLVWSPRMVYRAMTAALLKELGLS